jgi:hypothetical protein
MALTSDVFSLAELTPWTLASIPLMSTSRAAPPTHREMYRAHRTTVGTSGHCSYTLEADSGEWRHRGPSGATRSSPVIISIEIAAMKPPLVGALAEPASTRALNQLNRQTNQQCLQLFYQGDRCLPRWLQLRNRVAPRLPSHKRIRAKQNSTKPALNPFKPLSLFVPFRDGEQKVLWRGVAAGTIVGLALGLMIALFIAIKPELFTGLIR